MNELTFEIKLDNRNKHSIYQQIYEYIRNEIKCGNLKEGMKLPSTRALATHLEVSRSTVDMAYSQLVAEGYVYTQPARGYYVADVRQLYDIKIQKQKPEKQVDLPYDKEADTDSSAVIDFSPKGIDLSKFPFNTWRKLTKEILSADNKELFATGNPKGEVNLRRTISEYLYEARGVKCSYHQIILGAGYEYLLMLLTQIFRVNGITDVSVRAGGAQQGQIAMESPTYIQAYNVLKQIGYEVFLTPMDENGMDVEKLSGSSANLAYVMPSHQFPTGIVMPVKRRLEMLSWAGEQKERYIIEDDYDSEFRYVGKPIPALKAIDTKEKVIYLGTFSKSIAPGIRMSYMVLPEKLLSVYEKHLQFYSTTVSRVDQCIVNEFIRQGYYARHLNRMRSVYKGKHEVLLKELKNLNGTFTLMGANAGLHVLLELQDTIREEQFVERAKEAGVRVYPLSEYRIEDDKNAKPTVLLGYANLSEEEIRHGIALLGKVFSELNS